MYLDAVPTHKTLLDRRSASDVWVERPAAVARHYCTRDGSRFLPRMRRGTTKPPNRDVHVTKCIVQAKQRSDESKESDDKRLPQYRVVQSTELWSSPRGIISNRTRSMTDNKKTISIAASLLMSFTRP